jgi:ribosomal protein L11 methyltransferase
MKYTGITFEGLTHEQSDILIAVLPEYGFHGMEEMENCIKAYAKEGNVDLEGLTALSTEMNLTFTVQQIEEENWNQSWESNFEPVVIPGRIQVRAHFHEPIDSVDHQILITPKMSFGTGHHPTTKMMMLAMLERDFKEKSVADFGTGTGILSILAVQLGAKSVAAIDNDDWSIENVKENIELNNAQGIEVSKAGDLDNIDAVDVMLANINKNVLIEHVLSIRAKTKEKGTLIISGLLRTDYDDIVDVYVPIFGANHQKFEEGDWLAISFQA